MSDTKAMQRLCGLMRKAVQQYEILAPGDRVLGVADIYFFCKIFSYLLFVFTIFQFLQVCFVS